MFTASPPSPPCVGTIRSAEIYPLPGTGERIGIRVFVDREDGRVSRIRIDAGMPGAEESLKSLLAAANVEGIESFEQLVGRRVTIIQGPQRGGISRVRFEAADRANTGEGNHVTGKNNNDPVGSG